MSNLSHGHRRGSLRTPTYNSWRAMIERCTRPAHPKYENYGGRGVQVYPAWTGSGGFSRFLTDMGERPDGMTLDRVDGDGHYVPGNCRWATPSQQRWNRRDMVEPEEPRENRIPPLFAGQQLTVRAVAPDLPF